MQSNPAIGQSSKIKSVGGRDDDDGVDEMQRSFMC